MPGLLLPVALALSACLGQQDLDATMAIGAKELPLQVVSNTWPASGSTTTVRYCRRAADAKFSASEVARQWTFIGDSFARTWSRWTNIVLTDFGPCTSAITALPRIEFTLATGSHWGNCGLGAPVSPGLVTSCIVGLENDSNLTPEGNDELARGVTIHETGHGLGFSHEQTRPDALKPYPRCAAQGGEPISGTSGLVTLYDDYSIMSTCGPLDDEGHLSLGDIMGAQSVYGVSAAGRWLKSAAAITALVL